MSIPREGLVFEYVTDGRGCMIYMNKLDLRLTEMNICSIKGV